MPRLSREPPRMRNVRSSRAEKLTEENRILEFFITNKNVFVLITFPKFL
jgi:hypothetical protein